MNIKIKASGVACMVGEDYDRIYGALLKAFGEGSDSLFSKRVAGHEYLQWEIPGDGWRSLADADPFMEAQVKKELGIRREEILSKFGSNRQMAFNVLSVPADEYIYYKADTEGGIDIKLTAWGYKYPERVDGGNMIGTIDPLAEKQPLIIKFEDDGKGLANKLFKINGFKRVTDDSGEFTVGDIPVGTEFDIEVDGESKHYIVKKGENLILFDVTQYSHVDVEVKVNDQPAKGMTVTVNYGSRNMTLITDNRGKATLDIPHDSSNGLCRIKVEETAKEEPLKVGDNVFEFNLIKAEPEIPEPPVVPEPTVVESSIIPELPVVPEPPGVPDPPVIPDPPIVPDPPVVPEPPVNNDDTNKSNFWLIILGIIGMLLLILALVALTYYFGRGIMFN